MKNVWMVKDARNYNICGASKVPEKGKAEECLNEQEKEKVNFLQILNGL